MISSVACCNQQTSAMASQIENLPTFRKRPDVDAQKGIEFERKLTLLASLRCRRLHEAGVIKQFRVLQNVDDIGAFDDVVIKLEYKELDATKSKLVLIQAKHTQDPSKHSFTEDTLLAHSKPEIHKYYRSCSQIVDILNNAEIHKIQKGEKRDLQTLNNDRKNLQMLFDSKLENCIFVYYTNMPVNPDHFKVEGAKFQIGDTNDIVGNILNTTERNGICILQLNPSTLIETDICGPGNNTDYSSQFCEKFRIYIDQECEIESALIKEINLLKNSKYNDLYLCKLSTEFSYIFSGNYCTPLNEYSSSFSNVFDLVQLEQENKNFMENYSYFKNLFKQSILQILFEKIKDNPFSYVPITNETKNTEFMKFIELSRNYSLLENNDIQNLGFLILDSVLSVRLWKKARQTECYKKYQRVFLFFKNPSYINNFTDRLENENYLISSYPLEERADPERQSTVLPYDMSAEISENGWNQILQYNLSLQEYPTTLEILNFHSVIKNIDLNVISKMARNKDISVGTQLPNVDRYYIDRFFEHDKKKMRDTEFAIDCLARKLTVISDIAGMGKSTSLKFLCNHIKNLHHNYWVQYIELKLHIKTLSAIEENISSSEAVTVVSKLLVLTDLDEKIFRHLCLTTGSAVLLFDGYDEISPQAENQFKYLLTALTKTSILSIIISTRPNCVSALEDITNRKLINIIDFTSDDQELYLAKYWRGMLNEKGIDTAKLGNVVQHVVKKIGNNRTVLDEVAGIPLQTHMIAEIYYKNVQECLVEGSIDNIKINIDLVQLYDQFINLLIYRCMTEKVGVKDLEQTWYDIIKSDMFKFESGIWEAVACKEILPKMEVPIEYKEADKIAMQKVGILSKLDPITFMHRTLAEFLAAKYVFNILYDTCDDIALKFLFADIFTYANKGPMSIYKNRLSDQYTVFRIFLNSLLSNEERRICNETCHNIVRNKIKEYEDKPPGHLWLPPISLAAHDGNNGILQFLLQHGADVECKSNGDSTPIHLAANGGHSDTVKYLVQHGADINSRTKNGATAVHYATQKGHTDILKYLVQLDADIIRREMNDNELIISAARGGHPDTIEFLLQHGADINCTDDNGNKLIHMAAGSGKLNAVKYLLQHGADIYCRNKFDDTPLHKAVSPICCIDTVKYLVQQGANINATNNKDRTAADLARWQYKTSGGVRSYLVVANYLEEQISEQSVHDILCLYTHTPVV